MLCSKCGTENDGDSIIGKKCGHKLDASNSPDIEANSDKASVETVHQNDQQQKTLENTADRNATVSKVHPISKKKSIVFSAVAIVLVLIVASIVIIKTNNGSSNSTLYPCPELPDYIEIKSSDGYQIITPDNKLVSSSSISMAEDGTFATKIEGSEDLQIYQGGNVLATIPAPVEYYKISGSGKKLVYGTNDHNTYIYDIDKKESRLLSESKSAEISSYYSGDYFKLDNYYSIDGYSLLGTEYGYRLNGSDDGKYIYYGSEHSGSFEDTKMHNEYNLIIDGFHHYRILDYPDSKEWWG